MVLEEICIVQGRKTMANSPGASTTSTTTTTTSCSEIMTGNLAMIVGMTGGTPPLRVIVKVYRTSLEHFAIVYPDKVICKPIGYINLKNCYVQSNCCRTNGGRTFQVVRKSCDGGLLTFQVDSPKDIKVWMNALRPDNQSSSSSAACNDSNYGSGSRLSSTSCRKSVDSNWHLNVSLPVVEEGDEE